MTRLLLYAMVCAALVLSASGAVCGSFDERLWEKYAELIPTGKTVEKDGLAGVYLSPASLGDMAAKPPFSDLRVVTDEKEEVPWQIVVRRPECRRVEIPAKMRNLSQMKTGETWLELHIEKAGSEVSEIEIVTPNADFTRQVQVLGSADGTSWNAVRKNGVIFDIPQADKLRRTSIAFPTSMFRYLAVKIVNDEGQPLKIRGATAYHVVRSHGQTYSLHGAIGTTEIDAARRESRLIVNMNTAFPIDRLKIATKDRNFQRTVEVQVKKGSGDWEKWAQGAIFNYDTATMKESILTIDIPTIAAREYRLVFRNLDSPPLAVAGVTGEGYHRLMVFKNRPDRKLFLFWGNQRARMPQYDLVRLVAKEKLDTLARFSLGQSYPNTEFAGDESRLPFTERYKYLLYAVVALVIAGLVCLQYRVFRQVK